MAHEFQNCSNCGAPVEQSADGRTIESPEHKVEISTGGPQGSVPVIPVQ